MPIYTVSEQAALLGARNCVYRRMCGKGVVYTILHNDYAARYDFENYIGNYMVYKERKGWYERK